MEMRNIKCQDCGSTKFDKIDEKTYVCKYCGGISKIVEKSDQTNKSNKEKNKDITENEIVFEKFEPKKFLSTEEGEKALLRLLLTIFAGVWGVHLIFEKRIVLAVIYFLTFGILGIGWFLDSIRAVINFIQTYHSYKKLKKVERARVHHE